MAARLPWNNEIRTVEGLLRHAADRYESKDAVKYVNGKDIVSVSYRRFFEDSLAVAAYLDRVHPERCTVGLIGTTTYDFLVTMNAVFISGKILVPLSPEFTFEKTSLLLSRSQAKIILYDRLPMKGASPEDILPGLEYSCVISEFVGAALECGLTGSFPEKADADDTALILYTSGTTGDFKGVELSSSALVSNVLMDAMDFSGDNVALNVLPMHHIFCLSCDYLKNVNDGVTICLNPDLGGIYRNLKLFEPTILRLVPMMVQSLYAKVKIKASKHPEYTMRQAAESVFGKRINHVVSSGAALPHSLVAAYGEMGIILQQGYGMTETGPRISVPDKDTPLGSVGKILDGITARVRDGELQVRSPSLMTCYHDDPDATASVFTDDGWFRTGDLGKITDDRYLFIKGRLKNLIILSNGENVSPEEIEKKYTDHPLVKEVVVFEQDGAIMAEIYPDPAFIEENKIDDIPAVVGELVRKINLSGETTREVSGFSIRSTPFDKTSSGKIARKGTAL